MYGNWKNIGTGNTVPDEEWDEEPLELDQPEEELVELTPDKELITTVYAPVTDDEGDNFSQGEVVEAYAPPVETNNELARQPNCATPTNLPARRNQNERNRLQWTWNEAPVPNLGRIRSTMTSKPSDRVSGREDTGNENFTPESVVNPQVEPGSGRDQETGRDEEDTTRPQLWDDVEYNEEVIPLFDSAMMSVSMIQRSEIDETSYPKARMIPDAEARWIPSQYKDVFDEPNNFNDAWNHHDEFQHKQWQDAISKEFKTMHDHKVWNLIDRRQIPTGRKTIKCRWIFEIKRSGVFRARLVACGHSQVAGIDFMESFSPMMNDVTMRLLITTEIVNKYTSRIVDIERVFLHGVLEENKRIYMNCPEGLEHDDGQAVMLIKTIYGLVQASRAYFLLMVLTLKNFKFERSLADPCLFTRIDD